MAPRVLCGSCGTGTLEWAEGPDGGGGYLCQNWQKHDFGEGCYCLINPRDYREMLEDAKASAAIQQAEKSGPELLEKDSSPDGVSVKARNAAALLRGDLIVKRQPLLPKLLSVGDGAAVVRRQFKCPLPGGPTGPSKELLRRLGSRKQFVPWGGQRRVLQPLLPFQNYDTAAPVEEEEEDLPAGVEPLVLWQPEEGAQFVEENSQPILVDNMLVKFLRPHQREGVQFMFECVTGLRDFTMGDSQTEGGGMGCILADDMGLGKTLQSITLLWTLLNAGFDGQPLAKKAMIVTPTSLVSNWESELNKWLNGKVNVMALAESSRADVVSGIATFTSKKSPCQVLIISYETFRLHAARLQKPDEVDLLICDEAHRLKNEKTLTNQALAALSCRRRVLLSGTPMQNDLEEFYAMVNFTNPGILGDPSVFRRYFESPILQGREPEATEEEQALASERSGELSDKVNQFILRRTNALLSNHLPPKVIEVVCCKLTPLQITLYNHFLHSKNMRKAFEDPTKTSRVLACITALKKLCNHPKLIYDTVRGGGSAAAGFEDCLQFFPQEMLAGRTGTWNGGDGSWVELSGKMLVLARLLAHLRRTTDDRIVLVSNYTQTLDLFSQLCRERNYPYVRLDGTTSIAKRQKLVQRFNDPLQNEFAFLLSSKAGGCGLNLIGGNRLVLFDPDWNPATDKQAAARVWRDGQKKRVYVYRFLAAGTIEEKVFQRQMSKEGLQKVLDTDAAEPRAQTNTLSTEALRDLFTLRDTTRSDTHAGLKCRRCIEEAPTAATAAAAPTTDAAAPTTGAAAPTTDAAAPTTDAAAPTTGAAAPTTDAAALTASQEEAVDIGGFARVAGVRDLLRPWERQVGSPLEEELAQWGHHSGPASLPDRVLQMAAGDELAFVFSCQIGGKLVPLEPKVPSDHPSASGIRRAPAPHTPHPPTTRGGPFRAASMRSPTLAGATPDKDPSTTASDHKPRVSPKGLGSTGLGPHRGVGLGVKRPAASTGVSTPVATGVSTPVARASGDPRTRPSNPGAPESTSSGGAKPPLRALPQAAGVGGGSDKPQTRKVAGLAGVAGPSPTPGPKPVTTSASKQGKKTNANAKASAVVAKPAAGKKPQPPAKRTRRQPVVSESESGSDGEAWKSDGGADVASDSEDDFM